VGSEGWHCFAGHPKVQLKQAEKQIHPKKKHVTNLCKQFHHKLNALDLTAGQDGPLPLRFAALDLYPFCPGDRTQTTCHGRAFMLICLLKL